MLNQLLTFATGAAVGAVVGAGAAGFLAFIIVTSNNAEVRMNNPNKRLYYPVLLRVLAQLRSSIDRHDRHSVDVASGILKSELERLL